MGNIEYPVASTEFFDYTNEKNERIRGNECNISLRSLCAQQGPVSCQRMFRFYAVTDLLLSIIEVNLLVLRCLSAFRAYEKPFSDTGIRHAFNLVIYP